MNENEIIGHEIVTHSERSKKRVFNIFQLCIICINVIGLDASLYVVANAVTLLFFATAFILLKSNKQKITIGQSLLLPICVYAYSVASVIWAVDSAAAISQIRTQTLLLVLCSTIYIVCYIYPSLCYVYIRAIYLSAYLMIAYSFIVYGGISGFISTLNTLGRMGGAINGENGFGLLFAEGSIASFYYLLYENKRHAWLGILLFPIFAFTSGSKKAVVFIFLGLTFLLSLKYGIKKLYKALFAILIIIIVGYYVIKMPAFSVLYARIDAFLQGTSYTDALRERMIDRGIELFTTDHTLFGYGIDNYRVVSGFGLYSHNNYIESLVGLGLLGTILYYGMYVKGITGVIKAAKIKHEYKGFLLIMGLYVAMEYGMVTMYSKEIWILIGIALAIADGAVNIRKPDENNEFER